MKKKIFIIVCLLFVLLPLNISAFQKKLDLIYGSAIGITAYSGCRLILTLTPPQQSLKTIRGKSFLIGLGIVISISVGKELLYDGLYLKERMFFHDIVYRIGVGFIAECLPLLIDCLIFKDKKNKTVSWKINPINKQFCLTMLF